MVSWLMTLYVRCYLTFLFLTCHWKPSHGVSTCSFESIYIVALGAGYKEKPRSATDKALMSAFETMKEPASSRQSLGSEVEVGSTNGQDKDTPHVKKRHRRMKSSGVKKDGDEGK